MIISNRLRTVVLVCAVAGVALLFVGSGLANDCCNSTATVRESFTWVGEADECGQVTCDPPTCECGPGVLCIGWGPTGSHIVMGQFQCTLSGEICIVTCEPLTSSGENCQFPSPTEEECGQEP